MVEALKLGVAPDEPLVAGLGQAGDVDQSRMRRLPADRRNSLDFKVADGRDAVAPAAPGSTFKSQARRFLGRRRGLLLLDRLRHVGDLIGDLDICRLRSLGAETGERLAVAWTKVLVVDLLKPWIGVQSISSGQKWTPSSLLCRSRMIGISLSRI